MAGPLKTFTLGSGRSFAQLSADQQAKAIQSLGRQLYREAQGIMAASQGLVPVDTGALRSSGYVEEPKYDGGTVEVDLGYGGPAAKINPKTGESTDSYAIYVHEDHNAFHKVGTAKFLSMPFDQATAGMAERVAAGMKGDGSDVPNMPEDQAGG